MYSGTLSIRTPMEHAIVSSSFFCRDKGNCLLYTGVHNEGVSIEQGSIVLLCKKIIVHLKEKCKLEK